MKAADRKRLEDLEDSVIAAAVIARIDPSPSHLEKLARITRRLMDLLVELRIVR